MNVYIDVQARSLINLLHKGAEKYIRHPSFEILVITIKFNEEYIIYFNDKFQSNSIDISHFKTYTTDFNYVINIIEDFNEMDNVKFIAHWARFEKLSLGKFITNFRKSQWTCTALLANRKYLPPKLGELSIKLKLSQRMPEHMNWINAYCVPNSRGRFNYKTIPAKDILKMFHYSKLQVDLCEEVYNKIG